MGLRAANPADTMLGALAAGGQHLAGALDEIQKSKESAWVARTASEADIWAADEERRLESESTDRATGHVEAFKTAWQEYSSGVLDSAPSRRSREALQNYLLTIGTNATKRRGAFQAKADLTARLTDFETAAQNNVFAASQSPGSLGDILTRSEAMLNDAAAWLPADALVETRKNARAAIFAGAVEGLIGQEDFDAARAIVQGTDYETMLDAPTRMALQGKIDAAETGAFVRDEGKAIGTEMAGASPVLTQIGAATPQLVDAMVVQESSGRVHAVSPKGALGLMQLMPATAEEMANELGVPYDPARLTTDREYNKMLGTHYLNKQLTKYSGNVVLALAAYNAGPDKVDEWLGRFGDPRSGAISTEDWSSKIPYKETREYVAKINERMGGSAMYPDQILRERVAGILDPAVRDRVIREANTIYGLGSGDRAREAAQAQLQRDMAYAQLQVELNRGNAGTAEFDAALQNGAISPSQWSTLTRGFEQDFAAIRSAQTRIASGGAFNVYDTKDKAAVDLLYEKLGSSPETGVALAAKTGIIPEGMFNDLRQRMATGDQNAFELAENVDRVAPRGFRARGGGAELDKQIDTFRALNRIGYSPAEAARRASRSPEQTASNEATVRDANRILGKMSASDIMGTLDASGWGVTVSPARQGRIVEDFQTAYTEARIDGFSDSEAQDIAAERLDRHWGYTDVNGSEDEVMRFPPEKYYPIDPVSGDHSYVRKQAIEDVRGATGFAPENLGLMSDIQTEADVRAGAPPRYKIGYTDEAGFFQMLPGYYRPDAEALIIEHRAEDRRQSTENKARFDAARRDAARVEKSRQRFELGRRRLRGEAPPAFSPEARMARPPKPRPPAKVAPEAPNMNPALTANPNDPFVRGK